MAFVSQNLLFTITCEAVSLCLFEYAYINCMLTGPILKQECKSANFSKKPHQKPPKPTKELSRLGTGLTSCQFSILIVFNSLIFF